MSQSKIRLLELNARLAQNLNAFAVEATAEETTTALVRKVADIPAAKDEQEKVITITENGTTKVVPDEGKVLSKVTVDVDVPSSDSFYDIFWDNFQQYGERTNYTNAFTSPTIKMFIWTDENFSPKHDMSPTTMSDMFKYSDIQDVKGILERLGRKFDTSQCTNFTFAFRDSAVTYLPVLDLSSAGTLNCTFMNSTKLKTLHLKNMHTNVGCASNTFLGCNSLTDVIIEGEIGTTFDIKWSPLTVISAISVLTHLVNYVGTENEFAYSVLFADSVWELLNAEGATAPGNITWEEYVNSIGWNK